MSKLFLFLLLGLLPANVTYAYETDYSYIGTGTSSLSGERFSDDYTDENQPIAFSSGIYFNDIFCQISGDDPVDMKSLTLVIPLIKVDKPEIVAALKTNHVPEEMIDKLRKSQPIVCKTEDERKLFVIILSIIVNLNLDNLEPIGYQKIKITYCLYDGWWEVQGEIRNSSPIASELNLKGYGAYIAKTYKSRYGHEFVYIITKTEEIRGDMWNEYEYYKTEK